MDVAVKAKMDGIKMVYDAHDGTSFSGTNIFFKMIKYSLMHNIMMSPVNSTNAPLCHKRPAIIIRLKTIALPKRVKNVGRCNAT